MDVVSMLGNSYVICTGVWTVAIVRQEESDKDQLIQNKTRNNRSVEAFLSWFKLPASFYVQFGAFSKSIVL